jgi:hypothetical protein
MVKAYILTNSPISTEPIPNSQSNPIAITKPIKEIKTVSKANRL